MAMGDETVVTSQPGHVGAHLTFTDCQYTVDTTLDGKPISGLDKLLGKRAKTRYLLREFALVAALATCRPCRLPQRPCAIQPALAHTAHRRRELRRLSLCVQAASRAR